ncbi:MAG: SpoIIE family protein phosphatase [Spirochaetes bacterium]|nr:SpoIIE family protein phosphatase [Spirochaetota bacterium]
MGNKRPRLHYLFYYCFAIFASCTGVQEKETQTIDLSTGWYYAVGEVSDTPTDAMQRNYLPIRELLHVEKLHPQEEGVVWLKKEFVVPAMFLGKQVSVILGTINPADETYFNGKLIGKGGSIPSEGRQFFSEWNRYRKYDIPSDFVVRGKNVILVKLYVHHEGLIEGVLKFGERDAIAREYAIHKFIREDINALIAFVMLIIGLYHFLIFAKRPKDKENLYYALISVFFAIYQTNFYASHTPFNLQYRMSYLTFQKIIFVSLYASAYFFVLFTNSFLEIKLPRIANLTISTIFAISALVIVLVRDYGYFVWFSKSLNAIVVLPTVLYCFSLIAYKAIKGNRIARITLLGLIPFALCVIFDVVVHNILKKIGYIYLSGLGFPAFLISIMFILANRFVEYHNEVEELNITLDRKVVERTRELQEANAKLSEAYEAMSRDMKMAVSVQESFLPLKPPRFPGWDVALYFKPMSGVSGDFFDFYERNGELVGISIFDVSGHGVASGLLTMVAKSIMYKNFHQTTNSRLGAIVERANDDLIAEIGDSGYYISGIVLRINDSIVEYVNAAHVDLLIKRGGGEAKVVMEGKKEFKGNFLGIEAMKGRFATVQFKVNSNDSLLLCTDGLVECCNDEKNQYGIERLLSVFATLPHTLSAQEMLDSIMEDFYTFVGRKDEYRDDITIIIAKRLS